MTHVAQFPHLINSQSQGLLGAMRRIYVAMATISAKRQQRSFSAPSSHSGLVMISELGLGPSSLRSLKGRSPDKKFGKSSPVVDANGQSSTL
jgi:hypothetical protein